MGVSISLKTTVVHGFRALGPQTAISARKQGSALISGGLPWRKIERKCDSSRNWRQSLAPRVLLLRKVLSTLKIYVRLLPVDYFDVFTFLFPTAKSSDCRKMVLAVGYKISGGKQTCSLKTFISDFPGNF